MDDEYANWYESRCSKQLVGDLMKTVQINGIQVPAIGIGTWNLGDTPAKLNDEVNAIKAGIDRGARVIDTAEMYGNGRAERVARKAINGYHRDQLFVIDKVLPSNASAKRLEQSLDQSLANVGTDYFDLYLLHWRGAVPLSETVDEMEKMVTKGKIKSWGVSNFDVSDLEELWSLTDGHHCVANQDLYNLDERGIEYDLLPLMAKQHLPLIAYSPLAQGDTISGKLSKNKVLQAIASNHQVTVYQVMLAWTIRNGNVLAIPKSSTVDHAIANWEAGEIDFSNDELTMLSKDFPAPTKKQPLAVI